MGVRGREVARAKANPDLPPVGIALCMERNSSKLSKEEKGEKDTLVHLG